MSNKLFDNFSSWVVRFVKKNCKKITIMDRFEELPYMTRYYVLFEDRPKWFPLNITVHNIHRSDIDDMHDHPWPYASLILKGGYWENTPEGRFWRGPGHFRINDENSLHWLELDTEKMDGDEIWTLFIMGKRKKQWGFVPDDGKWIYYKDYISKKYNERYEEGRIKND
jgi:hypothetical protein